MRKSIPLILLLCAQSNAQNTAQIDLHLYAGDSAAVYVNGSLVTVPVCTHWAVAGRDTTSFPITIREGVNTLAVRAFGGGWDGAMLACMVLPSGDTIRSDSTWRCEAAAPPGDWLHDAYNDSTWTAAGEYGVFTVPPVFGDPVCHGDTCPDLCGVFEDYRVPMTWHPATVWFRKQFAAQEGAGRVCLRGDNVQVRTWLNGIALDTSYRAPSATTMTEIPCSLNTGANVLILEERYEPGLPDALEQFLKAGVNWGPGWQFSVLSDTTWDVSFRPDTGWHDTSYNAAALASAGTLRRYDSVSDILQDASWIAPNPVHFRREFYWDGTSAVNPDDPVRRHAGISPTSHEGAPLWYDLSGRRVAVSVGGRTDRACRIVWTVKGRARLVVSRR
jgi:hypothetical protein